MVLRGAVVSLVNGHGSMYNLWLDGLLVDDWLDGLVNVVMDMLARGNWEGGFSVVGLVCCGGVLELGSFPGETVLRFTLVVVMKLAVFNWDHVVGVLLRENLLVL